MRRILPALCLLAASPVMAIDFELLESIRLDELDTIDNQANLGMAVAGSGRWVFAGSMLQTRRFGQVYVFEVTQDPLAVTPVGALRPAEFDPWVEVNSGSRAGQFGSSIAVSGEWLAVGAPFAKENADGSGVNTGAVFLFRNSGGGANPWQLAQRLVPVQAPAAAAYTSYGLPVAIDGDLLAIGVPLGSVAVGGSLVDSSGLVDIWRLEGDTWTFHKRIEPPVPAVNDRFGYALALADGVLAVGAPLVDDDEETTDTGRVSVFRRNLGGTDAFGLDQTLAAATRIAGDEFGRAVELAPSALFVGTQRGGEEISGESGTGSIHRFRYASGTWEEMGEQLGYDNHNVLPWGPGLDYHQGLLASSVPTLFEGMVSIWDVSGSDLDLEDSETDQPPLTNGHYGTALALQRSGNVRVLTVGAHAMENEVGTAMGRIDVLVFDEGIFADGFED